MRARLATLREAAAAALEIRGAVSTYNFTAIETREILAACDDIAKLSAQLYSAIDQLDANP